MKMKQFILTGLMLIGMPIHWQSIVACDDSGISDEGYDRHISLMDTSAEDDTLKIKDLSIEADMLARSLDNFKSALYLKYPDYSRKTKEKGMGVYVSARLWVCLSSVVGNLGTVVNPSTRSTSKKTVSSCVNIDDKTMVRISPHSSICSARSTILLPAQGELEYRYNVLSDGGTIDDAENEFSYFGVKWPTPFKHDEGKRFSIAKLEREVGTIQEKLILINNMYMRAPYYLEKPARGYLQKIKEFFPKEDDGWLLTQSEFLENPYTLKIGMVSMQIANPMMLPIPKGTPIEITKLSESYKESTYSFFNCKPKMDLRVIPMSDEDYEETSGEITKLQSQIEEIHEDVSNIMETYVGLPDYRTSEVQLWNKEYISISNGWIYAQVYTGFSKIESEPEAVFQIYRGSDIGSEIPLGYTNKTKNYFSSFFFPISKGMKYRFTGNNLIPVLKFIPCKKPELLV